MRSRGPTLRCTHLTVPKEAAHPDDIEDACAFDEAAGFVAVVDGASMGYDPVAWSRILAAAALDVFHASGGADVKAVAGEARRRWEQRPAPNLPPGIRETPTGATIGLVRMEPSRGGLVLEGQLVGDVNLLLCSPGREPRVPADLSRAGHYGGQPETLNTHPRAKITVRHLEPTPLRRGDAIFLFTDGFGKWLLERAGCRPMLDHIRQIDAASFEVLVRNEQQAGRMDVDDVTVVRCEVA